MVIMEGIMLVMDFYHLLANPIANFIYGYGSHDGYSNHHDIDT